MQDSYLTYVVGVLIFRLRPAFNAGDWKTRRCTARCSESLPTQQTTSRISPP
jgi:hypothetical protein